MSNQPTVTVTEESEDVTQRERSPAENAFCESFLIQSRSAIENLYASNVYHSQRHAKQVKDLERQKHYSMLRMSNNQKEMFKKMMQLHEKQGQIMEKKRNQRYPDVTKGAQRIRPRSTSSVADHDPRMLRQRSGSLPFIELIDCDDASQSFSKSSQTIASDSYGLSASYPSSALSRSCDVLPSVGEKSSRSVFPELSATSPRRRSAEESLEDSNSTFITRIAVSPIDKPKLNLTFPPSGLKPEYRRRSLDPSVTRELGMPRGTQTAASPTKSTHTKWVPKSYRSIQGRGLPPS